MDFLSSLKIKDAFLKLHAYILKLCGKKMVALDNYKEEIVEVGLNYTSPHITADKSKGANFRWSKKMHPDYEKYFEIDGNTRRYFTSKGQLLWIKRV
jgi:hypothetical protein